jgi:hypothetical protein
VLAETEAISSYQVPRAEEEKWTESELPKADKAVEKSSDGSQTEIKGAIFQQS